MSPSMSRKYKYSNGKFWLLMGVCLTLLTLSGVYHAYSLRNYARQIHAEFRLSLSLLLKTTHSAVISQKRDALHSLATATVNKLQFLDNTPVVTHWLTATYWQFLSRQPLIRAVALYSKQGDLQLMVGTPTSCLNEIFAFDGFCVDRGIQAIRVSTPVYVLDGSRAGYLSAVVLISPQDIARAERDFGLRVNILAQQAIYSSLALPSLPENIRIPAPVMIQREMSSRVSRVWQDGSLWLVLTIRLGRTADDVVVQVAKNADFFIWKVIEAIIINSFLIVATGICFGFFHVNYRHISHTYRSVIDGMADMLAYKDEHGVYQMINTVMARTLFDRHPKEAVGLTDAQIGLPDDWRDQCEDSDLAVAETQQAQHVIERGLTASGRFVVLDVLKTPMYSEYGTFGGVIVCGRDISEQTQLQATLDALEDSYFSSEWILAKLLQNMPEYIYVKDAQHRFIRASNSVCDFYQQEVSGKTDFDLLPVELAKTFWQEEDALLSGQQETITRQDHVVTNDGASRHVLTTKTVFRDKQGRIAGLLGIGKDVTEMMDKQTAYAFVIANLTEESRRHVAHIKRRTDDIKEESHAD